MPSFRMHLPIGVMSPGITPAEVMEQAELALGTLHVVEKQDVEAPLIGGRRIGRVVLRFAVESSSRDHEDATARKALQVVIGHLEETTATIAPPFAVQLTRGMSGRFHSIPLG